MITLPDNVNRSNNGQESLLPYQVKSTHAVFFFFWQFCYVLQKKKLYFLSIIGPRQAPLKTDYWKCGYGYRFWREHPIYINSMHARSESDISVPGSSEMVFRQEKGMLTVAKKWRWQGWKGRDYQKIGYQIYRTPKNTWISHTEYPQWEPLFRCKTIFCTTTIFICEKKPAQCYE